MNNALGRYAAIVFDCDGVILNSNKVKSDAFYEAALPYGQEAAKALLDFHVQNGGVSRYKKFELFLENMVSSDKRGPGLEELLERFAKAVRAGLSRCEIAEGLDELRRMTPNARWFIVSGGDQEELRELFGERGLDDYFDGGIFGSPATKDEILSREIGEKNIRFPAVFVGDSKYDHVAAYRASLDFIFVSEWTEFREWPEYCEKHRIVTTSKLSELLSF